MKNVFYSLIAFAAVGFFVGCSGSNNSSPAQTCQAGMTWNGTQCVYANGQYGYGYTNGQYGYGQTNPYVQQRCAQYSMAFYPPNYCTDGRSLYPVY